MDSRPAHADDVPAIAALTNRWETLWFGAPEESAAEVREGFDRAKASRALVDGDRLLAAAWYAGHEATLVVDPDGPLPDLYADLLAWLATAPGMTVTALNQDDALRGALAAHGWTHVNSSFELVREVTADWRLDEPRWPAGITVRDLGPDDAAAVHELIYVDAAWAEVRGHPERDLESWTSIFLTENTRPEQQVLAWRDGRLVGAAMGRVFDDGTGWVAQLAVAKAERGQGLGRALLLEALRRRRDAGASALGLSVSEVNRNALALYLGVGLRIDREWMEYASPA